MWTLPLISLQVRSISPLQQRLFATSLISQCPRKILSENLRFAPKLGIDRTTDRA